ncbi:hypothetical protein [Streptomyces sp. NPDC060333]|uniref:hypothetical protein n=1 Tax=Streptomyces sp. NPDC060333 TaxID=3347098 RepID=UPI0036657367
MSASWSEGTGSPHSDEKRRFDVLALDYEMAREDERTFANIQAAVASITVILLGAVATVVSDACELKEPGKRYNCKEIPALFLAGAPAIPLATLAFVQLLGMVAALRSYYIRAVENELRKYAPSPLSDLSAVGPISPASYHGLITEVTTLRRGRAGYRILATMIMLVALGVFGGLTVYIAIKLDGSYRNAILIGYGTAFAVLIADVVGSTFGARFTFFQVARSYRDRKNRPLLDGNVPTGRSLTSYLLLPRPEDWIKWLFIPGGYLVAAWSTRGTLDLGTLALAVVITEYLVYSARYQWNDIRGWADDESHPHSAARLRLPFVQGEDRQANRQRRLIVVSSSIILLLRLATAAMLGIAMGRTSATLILIALVFTIGALYEFLRAAECFGNTPRVAAAGLIWIVVGTGYGLRYLVGVYATGVPLSSSIATTGALFTYFFGIMFVLLTWVLEATSYCHEKIAARYTDGHLQQPACWYAADQLFRKPHLMLLLRSLPWLAVHEDPSEGNPPRDCGGYPALKEGTSLFAPWNLAYWAACTASAWLAANLMRNSTGSDEVVKLAVIGLAGSVAVSYVSHPARRSVTGLCAIVPLWVATAWDNGPHFDRPDGAMSLIPWALVTATYLTFRYQTYDRLKKFPKDMGQFTRKLGQSITKAIVGPDTWDKIR